MQVKWTELIPLDEDGVNTIREVSGVYRISHYDQDNKSYYIHYVGQAENLKERLNQHLYGNETNSGCNKFFKRSSNFGDFTSNFTFSHSLNCFFR